VAVSLVLQVLVVHVPFLNEAFSTVPLSLAEWLTCLAVASLVLWAEELKKLVTRARDRAA
ncbi:MAG TPA: cation transporting ATPase C-terminal domain-containing protein, partial [Acidimicrobiia bacterium]|nr:cation transporting ATPase C-terminal domain-containing protein [Acidimicrobiia bacterium]